ncbi:MAG: hypothetical protein E6K76_00295 [Candidatus Eisenbacteria bacterium]|uniref:Uncharacterized protein n=1 Tax=Eiseniibacteriota bacterium TaxID=2212470 RepID=A0A538TBP8_UNCEI|nr:MAG: hypothetical protein E6K76_00295 [Candidatus Eisenbacteria bacterium]
MLLEDAEHVFDLVRPQVAERFWKLAELQGQGAEVQSQGASTLANAAMEKDAAWLESQLGPDSHGGVVDRQITYPGNAPNRAVDLLVQLVETGATSQALLCRQQTSLHVCEWRPANALIEFLVRGMGIDSGC